MQNRQLSRRQRLDPNAHNPTGNPIDASSISTSRVVNYMPGLVDDAGEVGRIGLPGASPSHTDRVKLTSPTNLLVAVNAVSKYATCTP